MFKKLQKNLKKLFGHTKAGTTSTAILAYLI
jgi:hypothetical protein